MSNTDNMNNMDNADNTNNAGGSGGDYIFIRAWGRILHMGDGGTATFLEKARKDGAPPRAIYFNEYEQKWVTVDELKAKNLKESVLDAAKKFSE